MQALARKLKENDPILRSFTVGWKGMEVYMRAYNPENAYYRVRDKYGALMECPIDGKLWVREDNFEGRPKELTYHDLRVIGFVDW